MSREELVKKTIHDLHKRKVNKNKREKRDIEGYISTTVLRMRKRGKSQFKYNHGD